MSDCNCPDVSLELESLRSEVRNMQSVLTSVVTNLDQFAIDFLGTKVSLEALNIDFSAFTEATSESLTQASKSQLTEESLKVIFDAAISKRNANQEQLVAFVDEVKAKLQQAVGQLQPQEDAQVSLPLE